MSRCAHLFAIALLSIAFVACDDDEPPMMSSPFCVPDEAAWNETIAPMVESYCADCHAEEPRFGAPLSLVSYDAITSGTPGSRHADLMALQLESGAMPPAGSARPNQDILEAIARWSSCGEVGASDMGGTVVTAPPIRAPEEAPEGMEHFDVLATNFAVGPGVGDLYQCFVLEAPITETRFIKRFEAIIDDDRVLHHLVLLRDTERRAETDPHVCWDMPQGSDYLAAWAPGGNAFEFPEGGMRVEPGERFLLQIHYNNRAGHEDVVDASGMRIFHGPPVGPEYGMVSIGPLGFEIPPRGAHDVSSFCTIRERTTFYASSPHMHEIGAAFSQEILRADGTREDLITLDGWDFDLQIPYHTPVVIEPGERLLTTCTFENTSDRTVINGPGTDDEMCFNFAYVTPPPASRYCDENGRPPREYERGECAPVPGIMPSPMRGNLVIGEADGLDGGELRDGLYEVERIDLYLRSPETPVGVINPSNSSTLAAGQLLVDGDRVQFDGHLDFSAVHEGGFSYDDGFEISFAGSYDTETQLLTTDCPAEYAGEMSTVFYAADGDQVVLGVNTGGPAGPTTVRMYFRRAE